MAAFWVVESDGADFLECPLSYPTLCHCPHLLAASCCCFHGVTIPTLCSASLWPWRILTDQRQASPTTEITTAATNSIDYSTTEVPSTKTKAIPTSTTEGNQPNLSGTNLKLLVIPVLVLLIAAVVGFIVWFKRKNRKRKKSWISRIRLGGNIPEARDRVSLVKVLPSPQYLSSTPQLAGLSGTASGTHAVQPMQFTIGDLSLLEVLKIGKQGNFYRAKITRGNCKGHRLVTCKLTMRSVSQHKLQVEVGIMNKLGYHKNIIQLLDWNISQEPYVLIMEHVGNWNLKTFLQNNKPQLTSSKNLQTQLTLAAYFISLGMEHIASRKVNARFRTAQLGTA
ncbi:fibroblast growth factor receptor-like [Rhincodon typus]|uniref:fibroblast growth factor receptor-like n=1 Tax=Rhincodon typus TaxID=259920 RepID=UPI00202FF9B1|nr:fibroblast growth factor receptor-like [Rhincodon typus]